MSVRFKETPIVELEHELEHAVEHALKLAAEETKGNAEAVAPDVTGAYKESLDVVVSGGRVYVVTHDFAGGLIEFGSQNNPVYAPIRRGARAAGLRISDSKGRR